MFTGRFQEHAPNGEKSQLAFFLGCVCPWSLKALSFRLSLGCLLGTRAAHLRTGQDTGSIKINENRLNLQSGKGGTNAVLAFGEEF